MSQSFVAKLSKNKETIQKAAFFASATMAFVTGLLFILLGDLMLKSGSPWLIGAVLLTFGSAVCVVLSEIFREKRLVFYILRPVGVAMMMAFIGYVVGYHSAMVEQFLTQPKFRGPNETVFVVMLIVASVAIVVEIVDLILALTIKDE